MGAMVCVAQDEVVRDMNRMATDYRLNWRWVVASGSYSILLSQDTTPALSPG